LRRAISSYSFYLKAMWVAGLSSWIHHSRVKGLNPSVIIASPSLSPESACLLLCEPLWWMKLLFKKKTPTDADTSPSWAFLIQTSNAS
jgi:hypothetical protein